MVVRLIKHCALILCAMIIVSTVWVDHAQAQGVKLYYACPYGPGPGEVEHHREPQYDTQGRLYNYLIFCVTADEAPQQQQHSPQAPPPPPRPVYYTDSYYAVVTHPDINDLWTSDSFLTQDAATKNAMDNCITLMGSGCSVMVSGVNEYVIVYAVNDASWKWTISDSPNDPQQMLQQCFAEGKRCQTAMLVDSRRMITPVGEELRDFQRSNKVGIRINEFTHKYGAIAWTGQGAPAARKIWVSNGHKTRQDAEKTSLELCQNAQKSSAEVCQPAISTANGVLIVWADKKKNVFFDSDVKLPFEWGSYDEKCKAKDPKCVLKQLIDVRYKGDFETLIDKVRPSL